MKRNQPKTPVKVSRVNHWGETLHYWVGKRHFHQGRDQMVTKCKLRGKHWLLWLA